MKDTSMETLICGISEHVKLQVLNIQYFRYRKCSEQFTKLIMVLRRTIFFQNTVQSIYSSKTHPLHFITIMCFCKALDIEFVTGSSAGSLRPHSDTVKKIPGLRPGHVFMSFCPIELIFIGEIDEIWQIFGVLRNFEFKPANEIF